MPAMPAMPTMPAVTRAIVRADIGGDEKKRKHSEGVGVDAGRSTQNQAAEAGSSRGGSWPQMPDRAEGRGAGPPRMDPAGPGSADV
ncbi:hypothetical protein G7Z17_g8049 [Cylindrodendrum hubeiense]|uniref:Uncharacterized protein n=1 Tax=Cylindrodendrum hubeiense TaxID=595255 RepID=A0A9P5HC02_9HYPO|nr:hypothetical protein G7Z17_g8049 [Cylindrodendrum hubeiense]